MKTLILILVIAVSTPYFVGRIQYANTIRVCQNLDLRDSDQDISNVLATFDFDLDVYDTPSFTDYYVSGAKAIVYSEY